MARLVGLTKGLSKVGICLAGVWNTPPTGYGGSCSSAAKRTEVGLLASTMSPTGRMHKSADTDTAGPSERPKRSRKQSSPKHTSPERPTQRLTRRSAKLAKESQESIEDEQQNFRASDGYPSPVKAPERKRHGTNESDRKGRKAAKSRRRSSPAAASRPGLDNQNDNDNDFENDNKREGDPASHETEVQRLHDIDACNSDLDNPSPQQADEPARLSGAGELQAEVPGANVHQDCHKQQARPTNDGVAGVQQQSASEAQAPAPAGKSKSVVDKGKKKDKGGRPPGAPPGLLKRDQHPATASPGQSHGQSSLKAFADLERQQHLQELKNARELETLCTIYIKLLSLPSWVPEEQQAWLLSLPPEPFEIPIVARVSQLKKRICEQSEGLMHVDGMRLYLEDVHSPGSAVKELTCEQDLPLFKAGVTEGAVIQLEYLDATVPEVFQAGLDTSTAQHPALADALAASRNASLQCSAQQQAQHVPAAAPRPSTGTGPGPSTSLGAAPARSASHSDLAAPARSAPFTSPPRATRSATAAAAATPTHPPPTSPTTRLHNRAMPQAADTHAQPHDAEPGVGAPAPRYPQLQLHSRGSTLGVAAPRDHAQAPSSPARSMYAEGASPPYHSPPAQHDRPGPSHAAPHQPRQMPAALSRHNLRHPQRHLDDDLWDVDTERHQGQRTKKPWSTQEVEALLGGVEQVGGFKWAEIKATYADQLRNRSQVQLKDKWRNLVKAAEKRFTEVRTAAMTDQIKRRVNALCHRYGMDG